VSGLEIITFGCRLNAFESEVIRQHASAALDGTIVVNTCAVTGEATRQARQAIRRARRENPSARIIVTGCAAQIDPDSFAAMPEVDRVLGNAEKLDPEALAGETRVAVADIMTVRETAAHLLDGDALSSFGERTRAFVQVQQGCDHRCTFCIIPFARGPSRSVPMGAVVQQVRRLVEAGYAEVVLTGVDISSYGRDLPGHPSLGELVRRLLKAVPDLKRLRLSSLDPAVADEALFRALAEEERLMPHLHLSVQALDDMVLKRMKRRHSRAGALAFMARARAARPDVAFGADLIAGFPTETDAMFENTLAGVDEAGLTYLHVFPYSAHADTPGARMPQVPAPIRKGRAARLRAAGDRALARFLATQVGREADVLVESEGRGHSAHYAPVRLAFAAPGGALVRARIAEAARSYLVGTRAA
jgi:threonylcarbamoyladenosine tRNA methylthiotransferase MtaB